MENWGGNYAYRATAVHHPATLEHAREIIAAAPRIRVLGSRHTFTAMGDSAELISLAGLPAAVEVDRAASTVTVGAGATYAQLVAALEGEGLALDNLASLPHISVGGAVATATHGSGDAKGNLATAVCAIELVTSDGELLTSRAGDDDFEGMVVGLGALGAVTRVTLRVGPSYAIRQRAFEGMAWDALLVNFDAIMAAGESVSVFSRLGAATEQVWLKTRVGPEPERVRSELFGARAATVERHPIFANDPVHATPQLGVPGPWSERLPHFRSGFVPSNGEEIQSEYLVTRHHALAAIEALRARAAAMWPVLLVCEFRTMAADRLWLSPQYEQDTVGFHFTWRRDQSAVEGAVREVEAALAPFDARPHWGKLFLMGPADLARRYERLPDFARLAERLDPRGAFRNAWLDERVLGPGPSELGPNG